MDVVASEIRNQRERGYRVVLNSVSDGIISIDEDGPSPIRPAPPDTPVLSS